MTERNYGITKMNINYTNSNRSNTQQNPNNNSNNNNAPIIRSRTNNKIDSALLICHRCSRMEDCADELEGLLENVDEMGEEDLRDIIEKIQQLYLPLICTAVTTEIPDAINHLLPIPGIKNTHLSREVEITRDAQRRVAGRRRQQMSVRQHLICDTLVLQKEGGGIKRFCSRSLPTQEQSTRPQVESPTEESTGQSTSTSLSPQEIEPLLPPRL